ncbi:Hcp family type VI secretion system effector [Serratia fonticola]|uniref:Hcp family type VI secretion system effector n=1 Tax=Serratia fonticola TaxID=47917 RepID=UPI002179249C|nr:Hcp family type VI secretion system effector [Serratia fonticola]CAI1596237.1 Secreted protein hcp [Serratia fonticola]CAI1709558.1 Secreted protein hcp [Serratia fonticola]CAI1749705.1 Secreted protein hcp [Serratia fonticola]
MANLIYLTAEGRTQGLISAGCSTYASIGNRYQVGHEDEIPIFSFDHDLTREQHVNHQPIDFVKAIDKSSPLFGIAITNNELLTLRFDFYRTAADGTLELYYSIEITGVTIVGFSSHYPNSLTHNDAQPYESVSVKYQSVTWKHHAAGTSGYSIWADNVY